MRLQMELAEYDSVDLVAACLVGFGQGVGRGCRQHAHQLVEGLEGLPNLKLYVQLRKPDQV